MHISQRDIKTQSFITPGELEMFRRTIIGESNSDRPHIILSNPHGGDYHRFLSEYPQYLDQFLDPNDSPSEARKKVQLIDKYMSLERDNGANELTKEIAERLASIAQGLRIEVLEAVNLPRGVVDLNRHMSKRYKSGNNKSHLRIIDYKEHPEIWEMLARFHDRYHGVLDNMLSCLHPSGCYIDVHTMNDYSISEGVELEADIEIVEKYLKAYTDPKNRKTPRKKRKFEIISSFGKAFPGEDIAKGDFVGHPILRHRLIRLLYAAKIPYGIDEVYPLDLERKNSHTMMKVKNRAISFDCPIWLLSRDGKSSPINPELDPIKIMSIANYLANAIYSSIDMDLEVKVEEADPGKTPKITVSRVPKEGEEPQQTAGICPEGIVN